MISYQLTEFGRPLRRSERATPTPQGREVVIRVTAAGVCHSDLHLLDGYFDLGDGKRLDLSRGCELPLTLGHEIAGEVVAVGPMCHEASVGDRRVVYPWFGCRECQVCAEGDEHLCARPNALGVVRDGGFSDHVVVPDPRYLFDFGETEDKLACTYACSGLTAYSAVMKVRDSASGRHLLLIGAGGVGFAAISLVRSLVDTTLIVADIDDTRLQTAADAGADEVVNVSAGNAAKQIRTLTDGGVAAAVDFVGSTETSGLALKVLGQGGVLIVVGLFGGAARLPLPLFPLKQLTVRGSYVGSLRQMAALSELVQAGKVPPIPLTDRPLDRVQTALDDLRAGRAVGRIVLTPASS